MTSTVRVIIVFIAFILAFRCANGQSMRVSSLSLTDGVCFSETIHDTIVNHIQQNLTRTYCQPLYESVLNPNRPLLVTNTYGSLKGHYWNDVISTCDPMIVGIRSIQLQYQSNTIVSIQVTYLLADESLYSAAKHGGSGGLVINIVLAEDERLIRVEGRTDGRSITQLTFISSNSSDIQQTYGPYGGAAGGTIFSAAGYILGFKGYSDSSVQGFGVYYLPSLIRLNDSSGGECQEKIFDDRVDLIIPPVVAIRTIQVYHKLLFQGIRTVYALLGGSLHHTALTGSAAASGVVNATITLTNTDVIYEVTTHGYRAYPMFLSGLIFSVSINGSSEATSVVSYGPYGAGTANPTVTHVNVIGFHGYIGFNGGLEINNVCQIGFYQVDFNSTM